MVVSNEAIRQLNHIHRQRNRSTYLPHIFLVIVSSYIQREKLQADHLWIFPILAIALGSALRALLFEVFFQQWTMRSKGALFLNYLALFLVSGGWGLHAFAVYRHFGGGSFNISGTLMVLGMIITSACTSLAADKKSFFFFSLTISLIPATFYLLSPDMKYVALYIFVFYAFIAAQFFSSHRQLMTTVDSQVSALNERNRLKRLINAVPGYVCLIDSRLVYVEANDSMKSLFPDILGQKVGFSKTDAEYVKFIEDFVADKKDFEVREMEVEVRKKNHWFLVSIQRTEDDGAFIILVPMDELVKAKNELRKQEAKAHYTAKLASLGEMAAGIAHEVNNPLTIIQGSATLIQKLVEKEPLDLENIRRLTDKMVETSGRISKTIRSLRALSRNGEKDPFHPVSLQQILDQCLDISRQRFQLHQIQLQLPEIKEDVTFMGREVEIGQVLLNLISNAIDAVKNEKERWVHISYNISEKWLDILVSDSGHGVPEEIRHKIMEPFFTTKEVNQGTGLGLSISKTIMQGHGGELTLLSDVPHTTFRMRIPLN